MSLSRSSSAQEALEALGIRLREIRIEAGLTGRELARLAGWDGSKTSKVEHGKQAPTAPDIRIWCKYCGAEEQVTDLIASLHVVDSAYVEWRRKEREGLRHTQRSYSSLYDRSRLFRVYEPGVIPGLLQTAAYATARMSRIATFSRITNDVGQAVKARLELQRFLTSGNRRFLFVLEEWALRCRIGAPKILAGQLEHLIQAMALPSVSLGIIPADMDRTMWSNPGFWIFDDKLVHLETPTAEIKVTQPGEVAIYLRTFAELADMAVYGAAAKSLIRTAIDSLEIG